MEGRIDDARKLYGESIEAYERLGLHFSRAARSHLGAQIELLGGDPAAAARELRAGCETLEAMGERGVRSTLSGFLADVLCELGEDEEAWLLTRFTKGAAGSADLPAAGPVAPGGSTASVPGRGARGRPAGWL